MISVRKEELTLTFEAQRAWNNNSVKPSYHPHFGEVNQALLREIGRSLLDEGQVCQIHPQIRHTRRVAAVKGGGGCVQSLKNAYMPRLTTSDWVSFTSSESPSGS